MSHVLAIDQGTTSSRAIVFDERHGDRRHGAGGVPAALPAVGLGRARSGRHLGSTRRRLPRRDRAGRPRAGRRSPRSASPTSARRRWSGTARPASRSAAPSSGRTGGPARSAPSCARAGHEAMVTERTGLLLDPYFSGTKLKWLLDAHEGARASARDGRAARSAPSTAALIWKLTGGAVARDRRHQRRADAALQHPRGALGPGDLRAPRRAAWRCCRRCATAPADFGITRADLFGRRGADPRRRRRPAGGDGRAGLLRAGHAEGDLRHRLLRGAQHRRRRRSRAATGC